MLLRGSKRQRAPELNTENQKKFSVTAYVDNNCSSILPTLDRNYLGVVEAPSVLADVSLNDRTNSGLSCMTSGDMLEYLHHTQTISVKCKQTTRAVVIYIGCDQKLLFRFSVLSSGVQPSELHRKTDHLFGDVNRAAPPWIGRGLVHELNVRGWWEGSYVAWVSDASSNRNNEWWRGGQWGMMDWLCIIAGETLKFARRIPSARLFTL